MGWYHWGCVRVTEEPAGTWLCPSCSPNAAFYIKQLAKSRAAPPPIPRPGKVATASTSRGKVHVPKPVKTGTPKKKEQMPETKNERPAKKGTAVKKSAPQKPKPKWVGWVEMSSDEEEDFKKKVNAKFMMKDGVMGKRRRASRVAAENNETSSRGLGTRARAGERKNVVETDPVEEEKQHSESVHQQDEEDEEGEEEGESVSEASGHEKASVIEISSNDSSSSEDTMEIDEVADEEADKDSADETSDRLLDPKEERHISPDPVLIQTTVPSDRHDEEDFPEAAPKDLEGSMDIEVEQHESVEASVSDRDQTEGSENVDNDHASAPSRTHLDISRDRDVINLSSPSPKSTPATRSAGPSAALPHDQIVISDDSMDVDADLEGQEGQIFVTVTPAVQYNHHAALYQHRKNYWGDFPESALRSTLPRLA